MEINKNDLIERFSAMSEEELLRRINAGTLTALADEVARAELASRSIQTPTAAASDDAGATQALNLWKPMSVVVENTGAPRMPGLWRSRSAGIYFTVLGGFQLLGLSLALWRHSDVASSLAPAWLYAASFVHAISRLVAGIALLARSRIAVPALGGLAACAGVFLFGGDYLWQSQTGMPLNVPQLFTVLGRVDLLLIFITLIASFRWKTRGLLK